MWNFIFLGDNVNRNIYVYLWYLLMFFISNFTHKNKQKQFKTKKVFVRFNMFATLLSLYWKWLRNEKWKITQASINWACVGFFFQTGVIFQRENNWDQINVGNFKFGVAKYIHVRVTVVNDAVEHWHIYKDFARNSSICCDKKLIIHICS